MKGTGDAIGAVLAGLCLLVLARSVPVAAPPERITIGSKAFTESVILGEMLRLLAREAGFEAEHRRELGGTRVLWNALRAGEIDAYPEYTGTLRQEILTGEDLPSRAALEQALAARGLRMTAPLGFNNTYALGVKAALAKRLGLHSISDLKHHPELALGFSNEFMDRADGWPGLQQRYGLSQRNVRGLDHDLAYRGIESGTLQVTDVYTTDADITYYGLRVLKDDLDYFPAYDAVILYRADLQQRAPDVVARFKQLSGRIDAAAMRAMNARVKLQGQPESAVAAGFLK
jgi:osmoprotectant transport system permease protein